MRSATSAGAYFEIKFSSSLPDTAALTSAHILPLPPDAPVKSPAYHFKMDETYSSFFSESKRRPRFWSPKNCRADCSSWLFRTSLL
jgi:hypothetical protein